MNLIRYLLEYTIEEVFRGNKSECARHLDMSYDELKRIRKRISDGKNSMRLTESLLNLYWREGLSIDEALRSYTVSCCGSDFEATEKACADLAKTVRNVIESNRLTSQEEEYIFRAARNFFSEIEHYICGHVCRKGKYLDAECPVKRFQEYMQWLKKMIDESYSGE